MTIVVVDDEERVRLATTAMLEGLGCTVRTAQDTTTALTATADDTLDLALVDWTLAGETGLDVIDALRQQHPSLPTILITGETSSAHLNAAQASGIPLVHKPVAIDKLKQLIAEVWA